MSSFFIGETVKVWNIIGNYWVYTVILDKDIPHLYKVYDLKHKEIGYCEPRYMVKLSNTERVLYGAKRYL